MPENVDPWGQMVVTHGDRAKFVMERSISVYNDAPYWTVMRVVLMGGTSWYKSRYIGATFQARWNPYNWRGAERAILNAVKTREAAIANAQRTLASH